MAAGVLSFFLAMMTHPDIQRKAQEEIDAVIGTDRLPTFKDRSNLPFVSCLLWECLRWSPIAPMAVPHAPIQDDVYEGYWIPKGTTILPNVWSVFICPGSLRCFHLKIMSGRFEGVCFTTRRSIRMHSNSCLNVSQIRRRMLNQE